MSESTAPSCPPSEAPPPGPPSDPDLPRLPCPFAPHCQWISVPLPFSLALQLVQQHVQTVHQTAPGPAGVPVFPAAASTGPPSYEQAVMLPGPTIPTSLQISFPSRTLQAQQPILAPLSAPAPPPRPTSDITRYPAPTPRAPSRPDMESGETCCSNDEECGKCCCGFVIIMFLFVVPIVIILLV